MENIWMNSWPDNLPRKIEFEHGAVPIHEYLRIRAKETPEKTAIIFYGRQISYKELDESSERFAHYLIKNGVKKGDRVGIFLLNCPQYAIAHFGIQKAGAVVCPCSPLFKELELEYELKDADIEILVSLDLFYPVVKNVAEKTSLRKIITTNLNDYIPANPTLPLVGPMAVPKQKIPGTEDFIEIVANGDKTHVTVDIDMEKDIGLFQYTGGTTGLPKGCMLSFHAALFKTAVTRNVAAMTKDTICLVTMPIFHIAGMLAGMNSCIYAGATQVLLSMFDVKTAMKAISEYKADFWYSAVPMNVGIMAHPDVKEFDLSSLKLCLTSSFGIQLTEKISNQWKELTCGGLLIEGAYGLSETHTADTFMPRNRVKFGTCGIPGPAAEFKIVDLNNPDQELPIGEEGEIVLKNPGVFKGYWKRPEETAKTLIDGWVYTGDIGKFDADGYLYLLGRVKEMIKVSGFSVYPEEVELLLNAHPEVSQSAVIGVFDEKKGEVVKAYIVKAPGSDLDETGLIKWAKENMSSYKCPAVVEFRQTLPMLPTGKLLRRVLKEELKK
ncbi:MAG: AMP-binding protein [Desulfobacula sp.]|jgi:long-chain acyl-CoA synthetase